VPVAEVRDKHPLFDALGFDCLRAFAKRADDCTYYDFSAALPERAAIRTLIEDDPSLRARLQEIGNQLAAWWREHSPLLADLPKNRDLNRVRTAFLGTFVTALLPLNTLDRFKLAGVIATWWTETLPDFKTLVENGFPGVIDGWVDAIADAVDDDEAAGPAFDPFGHKLVLHAMTDYLERITAAKADIARFKGEKEAFEQSNVPDDLDEEEFADWNYAKDLESQIKEAKDAIREKLKTAKPLADKLKSLGKQTKTTAKVIASLGGEGPKSIARARKKGLPIAELEEALRQNQTAAESCQTEIGKLTAQLDAIQRSCEPDRERIASIEKELQPYEQIKEQLAEARARYRRLTDEFVSELKSRCGAMNGDRKRALVLELLAQDVLVGLDAAVVAKREELVGFIEGLWDKYAVPMGRLTSQRDHAAEQLSITFKNLSYVP
jgi:type I restriction enzyme M protein